MFSWKYEINHIPSSVDSLTVTMSEFVTLLEPLNTTRYDRNLISKSDQIVDSVLILGTKNTPKVKYVTIINNNGSEPYKIIQ